MRVIRIESVGRDYEYQWPDGSETYDYYVDYSGVAEDGQHKVRVGFGERPAFGGNRARVVVWIDGYPHAQFVGADDFEVSGEVLSEVKVPGDKGERMCRYPEESIPERYVMFDTEGLPARIQGPRVPCVWAVVSNIADHRTMIALAALRRLEKER